MHELALAQDIVAATLKAVKVAPARITVIGLTVGDLCGANLDSLEFCMRAVLDQHNMAHTEVQIRRVPAEVLCACGRHYNPPDMLTPCPECGGYERDLVAGQDLTIEYVETDDEQD